LAERAATVPLTNADEPPVRLGSGGGVTHAKHRGTVLVGVAAALAVAVGITALFFARSQHPESRRVLTVDTTVAPVTSAKPADPLAALGDCRPLVSGDIGPDGQLRPAPTSAPTSSLPLEELQKRAATGFTTQANTPCSKALLHAVLAALGDGWTPWEGGPIAMMAGPSNSLTSVPHGWGDVQARVLNAQGAGLAVQINVLPPGSPIANFGSAVAGLPAGWTGTSNVKPETMFEMARTSVLRPTTWPIMVTVNEITPALRLHAQHSTPSEAAAQQPLTYDELRDLAVTIAQTGPVQLPAKG
jgi:hypothetical protein